MNIEIKIDYVYISCDVMINIYSEIQSKDLSISLGWTYDLIDQIEWSLSILKKCNHKHYKELQNKYKKICDLEKEENGRPNKMGNTSSAIRK
jgi:hypothetical protein